MRQSRLSLARRTREVVSTWSAVSGSFQPSSARPVGLYRIRTKQHWFLMQPLVAVAVA